VNPPGHEERRGPSRAYRPLGGAGRPMGRQRYVWNAALPQYRRRRNSEYPYTLRSLGLTATLISAQADIVRTVGVWIAFIATGYIASVLAFNLILRRDASHRPTEDLLAKFAFLSLRTSAVLALLSLAGAISSSFWSNRNALSVRPWSALIGLPLLRLTFFLPSGLVSFASPTDSQIRTFFLHFYAVIAPLSVIYSLNHRLGTPSRPGTFGTDASRYTGEMNVSLSGGGMEKEEGVGSRLGVGLGNSR